MSEKLIREWVRQMLLERQILTFAAREEEQDESGNVTQTSSPEKRFALSSDQADKITDYLSTVDQETGEAPAETHDPVAFKEEIIEALPDEKASLFRTLIEKTYPELAGKSGGILDALKLIVMGSSVEDLAGALFSGTPPEDIENKVKPVKLETPALLAPLFHVEEKGRGKTMGRGEVLLTLSYLRTEGDAGGSFDVTIGGQNFHVKDLTKGKDIALGKTAGWDRGTFPFAQFASAEQPANLGELSEQAMMAAMPNVIAAYDTGWVPDDEGNPPKDTEGNSPAGPKKMPVTSKADLKAVAVHLQQTLDDLVAASPSFGGADGIIFAKGTTLYACGPKALHFSRTSQSALRVSPKDLWAVEDMLPYKAVLGSQSYIEKSKKRKEMLQATHSEIMKLISDWSAERASPDDASDARDIMDIEIFVALSQAFGGKKERVGKIKNPDDTVASYNPGWLSYVQLATGDNLKTTRSETKMWGKDGWIPLEDEHWQSFLEGIESISLNESLLRKYIRGMITEARGTDEKFTIKNENVVRSLVREAMITEELTKSDEDRIGVIIRKEIDTAWKKDLEKKVETLMAKQFKDAYNNDNFYKAVARVYKELMRVYAEEQWKFSRKFTRYDVPVARFRP